MRKNFGKQSWVLPQPVLIIATYDNEGRANAMNAAWGGMYDDNKIGICLGQHKTTDNIKLNKAFTVSFADVKNAVAADYVGIVSASEEPDKFKKAGFTAVRSERVNAPIIEQFPIALECELVKITEDGYVIGEIVNVSAEEQVLAPDGKPDWDKLGLIVFDPIHAAYARIGEKVGNAFSDGKRIK